MSIRAISDANHAAFASRVNRSRQVSMGEGGSGGTAADIPGREHADDCYYVRNRCVLAPTSRSLHEDDEVVT